MLPSNVDHGTVVGFFEDSFGNALAGSVTFTPQFTVARDASATPKTIILPSPVTATLTQGAFSVLLVATDDPDIGLTTWNYVVTPKFTGPNAPTMSPFPMYVPMNATTDLADTITVPSTTGALITKGDKGDKGDPGVGIPTGGTAGQTLVKSSATDYVMQWADAGGSGTNLVSYADQVETLSDYPESFPPDLSGVTPSDIGAQPSGDYATNTSLSSTNTLANGKYSKPAGGIPSTDLTSAVQTSLGKADGAVPTSRQVAGLDLTVDRNASALWAALGLVPTANLPALAINDTFTVANQAARLALTAQRGDMAFQTDTSTWYILAADAPATDANWKAISVPALVQSVAGKTGVVTLVPGDVGLGNVTNTSDANKPVSTAQQTAITAATVTSAIEVLWDPVAGAWPTYSTDPTRVRTFRSLGYPSATAPIAYNVNDLWQGAGS